MNNKSVAVVTGANRGIGLAVVRKLCKSFSGDVILTSRDSSKGQEALQQLKREGLKPKYHELDISQPASIRMFQEFIVEQYGGIDILINNAAHSFDKGEITPLFRKAKLSFDTDVFGTLNVCMILDRQLRPHARVIVMTNGYLGIKRALEGDALNKFDGDLSFHNLKELSWEYLKSVEYGTHEKYGWPGQPTQVAKIFQVEMTKILSKHLRDDPRRNILVNACCPGWTNSGASREFVDDDGKCRGQVRKSTDEAAEGIVWLATIPHNTPSPNGQVVRNKLPLMVT